MIRYRVLQFVLIALGGLVVSCNNQDSISSELPNAEYRFSFNPQQNKTFTYTTTTETTTNQEVNNEEITSFTKLSNTMEYNFVKDTPNSFKANTVYKKFNLYVKAKDEETELDAQSAIGSFDPTEKMFSALNNAKLNYVLDSTGEVRSFSGSKEIVAKMYEIANNNPQCLEMLNNSVKQYIGDEFFKQTAEQNFKFFTNRTLKIGDTVVQKGEVNVGMKLSANTIYKFITLKNKIATFEIKGKIEMNEQPITVEGIEVLATLKGVLEGTMLMDTQTGLQTSNTSTVKIKGVIVVMNRDVPISIKMINEVKLN